MPWKGRWKGSGRAAERQRKWHLLVHDGGHRARVNPVGERPAAVDGTLHVLRRTNAATSSRGPVYPY